MKNESQRFFEFLPFFIDTDRDILLLDRKPVRLNRQARRVLSVLIRNHGLVVKKETLLEECWNTHVQEDSLSQAIRAIRKALGDSRTDPKYIENVWGEGYSFIGKVREVGEGEGERIIEARVNQAITQPVAVPVETQLYNETIVATKKPAVLPPLQPGKRYSRSINRLEFASITLMMILAIMLIKPIFDELLGLRKPGPPKVEMPEPAPPQTVKDIAVLPVKFVSETGRDLGFSKAVTEEVISGLTRVNTVHVHSLKAVSTYTDSNVDPVVAGRELLADTVMQTVIKKVCDKFEITISLFLVANGKQLWQEVFFEKTPQKGLAQKSISERIVRALSVELLTLNKLPPVRSVNNSTEAMRFYKEGRFFCDKRTPDSLREAIRHFEQALGKDIYYAQAYAGLADCYALLGGVGYNEMSPEEAFPKAKEAALEALKLDNNLPEAHASLALVKLFYDHDWKGADDEFYRAIRLSLDQKKEYATARHWYANYFALMGRFEEAIVQIKRAKELEPVSLIIGSAEGWIYHFAGKYDEAIKVYNEALKLDSNFYVTHAFLGFAYEAKGMYKEAIREIKKAKELSNNSPVMIAHLGRLYAIQGNRDEAQKALDSLTEASKQNYVSPYLIAIIHIGLGDKDEAFKWLDKAHEEHSAWLVHLRVEPMLKSLHSDPRFADLLRRVGLAE